MFLARDLWWSWMCLLIVLTGFVREYPILVASNRDELRSRKASPPGLFVGETRLVLSPRDRQAGGTWLAVNDNGLFAGLTNLAGYPTREGDTSRGQIPHDALDCDDLETAVDRVRQTLAANNYAGFQLVLSDGVACRVLCWDREQLECVEAPSPVVVVGNQHRLGELEVPGLSAALLPGADADETLERLRPLLLDTGEQTGHPILKLGGEYGTISSSLIGVPSQDLRRLIWHYCPGSPDQTSYRNYGNLGRRLLEL